MHERDAYFLDGYLEEIRRLLSDKKISWNKFHAALSNGTLARVFDAIEAGESIQTEAQAEGNEEAEQYREDADNACMPEEALRETMKQIRRLERVNPDSAEAEVIRNYLDWITDLPWAIASADQVDLSAARMILDENHSFLDEVKGRILEHLAVYKLQGGIPRGLILCFVGSPGTGKTSLGRSIAAAMGREFVRASLGGVRDEAEIRGHRRTYIGSLPGRIIQGMRRARTANPVFLLDEIDKISQDFRGDPSSALLEVLDPEQNMHFSDHYLHVPFDLSHVFFIATANRVQPIPEALRDRMEIIPIRDYTPGEKIAIAKRHLVKRQMRNHELRGEQIFWAEDAFPEIVNRYAKEGSLRDLERLIATICRKAALRIVEGRRNKVVINSHTLREFLGTPTQAESGNYL